MWFEYCSPKALTKVARRAGHFRRERHAVLCSAAYSALPRTVSVAVVPVSIVTPITVVGAISVHVGVGTRAIEAVGIGVGTAPPAAIAIVNAEVDALWAGWNG